MDNLNDSLIYFRDDDVYELDENLLKVHSLFLKYKILIIYSVIPKLITEDFVSWMNEELQKYPDLVFLAQHGYSHTNHGYSKNKYEFGPNRTLKQQFQDIYLGMKIMKKNFPGINHHIFVPPYHKYDPNTIKCLYKLGFKKISVKSPNKQIFGFNNLPIHIGLEDFYFDPPRLKGLKGVISEISYLIENKSQVGIYLHHNLQTKKSIECLKAILNFILIISKRIKEVPPSQCLR